MMATAGYVQADALQPDPRMATGDAFNGLQWQVLTTPQRPSDRVEIRLLVNTGSLAESTQQSGYSHAIPRIALTQSGGLDAAQARSLWQQGIDPKRPMPPVIVSYDTTLFNLSLPNNRNDFAERGALLSGKCHWQTDYHARNHQPCVAKSGHGSSWPADIKGLVALSSERDQPC